IEGGHDDEKGIGLVGTDHRAAILRALMAWLRSRWRNTAGVMRARSRIWRRWRSRRGRLASKAAWARSTYQSILGEALPSARKRAALPWPLMMYQACQR